jgi:hypothetical protein
MYLNPFSYPQSKQVAKFTVNQISQLQTSYFHVAHLLHYIKQNEPKIYYKINDNYVSSTQKRDVLHTVALQKYLP